MCLADTNMTDKSTFDIVETEPDQRNVQAQVAAELQALKQKNSDVERQAERDLQELENKKRRFDDATTVNAAYLANKAKLHEEGMRSVCLDIVLCFA